MSKVEFNSGSVQGAACIHEMDCDNVQGNAEVCGNGKSQASVKNFECVRKLVCSPARGKQTSFN